MTKREKVMRGLECHSAHGFEMCCVCPYYPDELEYEDDDGLEGVSCEEKLASDALTLLKEQEPRVMTIDETIASHDNPVWLEENTLQGSYGAWGVVKGVHEKYNAVNIGGVRFGYWPRAKYNISWRCWNARPSPEQMRETPWEGEKDAE